MTNFIELVQGTAQDSGTLMLAVGILLRVTVVLSLGALLALALRRTSAALRHWVWALSLFGVVLLPFCYGAFPSLQWAILPPQQQKSVSVSLATTVEEEAATDGGSFSSEESPLGTFPEGVASTDTNASATGEAALAVTPPAAAKASWYHAWPFWFVVLWGAGTALGLAWLAMGIVTALHITRRSMSLEGSDWSTMLRQLTVASDIRRPVSVRASSGVSVPMTWGLRRPVILVPTSSHTWSEATKRSVLLHELGHVRRGDCLTRLLGRLACVLYWFHPLVWLVDRELRKTSEQAADDAVLSSNIAPPDYAEQLLGIVAQLRSNRLFGHVVLPMANKSDLEGRMIAILDSKRNRRTPRRKTCYALIALATILLVPCAMLRLSYAEPAESPSSSVAEKEGSAAAIAQISQEKPAASGKIVEGVGWKNAQVGMTREALLRAMGRPDGNSSASVLMWNDKHMMCTFHTGSKVVSEVRFNRGFNGALSSGITLGSSVAAVVKAYGKPENIFESQNGSQTYQYPSKGVWFFIIKGKVTQISTYKPYKHSGSSGKPYPAESVRIVEGVGWKNAQVGMTRDALLRAMGRPDQGSSPSWLRWNAKHVECTFHKGSTVVSEVRFNRGFNGALSCGITLGSSVDAVVKAYGKPEKVFKPNVGPKAYEYSSKGISFCIPDGKVTQILAFKPIPPRQGHFNSMKSSGIYYSLPNDEKLTEKQEEQDRKSIPMTKRSLEKSSESKEAASETSAPKIPEGSSLLPPSDEPAPPELVEKMLKTNKPWLRPQSNPDLKYLSYTFSMKHTHKDNRLTQHVKYVAPDSVKILREGKPDAQGYRNLGTRPQTLTAVVQGNTLYGPLHAIALSPKSPYLMTVVGEENIDGVDASILQLAKKPQAGQDKSKSRFRGKFGCGIFGTLYGGGSFAIDVDQIWVDKATGRVLREEAFMSKDGVHSKKPYCTTTYGDYIETSDGGQVPLKVEVMLEEDNPDDWPRKIYPWVFRMRFQLLDDKVWLLKDLEEFQHEKKVATATVTDAGTAEFEVDDPTVSKLRVEFTTEYEPLPNDEKLNEMQSLYCRWDTKHFGIPDVKKCEKFSSDEKAEAEKLYLKMLESPQQSIRVRAINALVGLQSKKAVAPILKIAADRKEKNNWDRHMACRALGLLGDKSVVPELVHLTYHFNWNTRLGARVALTRLTGQNFGDDVKAWRQWWYEQGGQPPISEETVTWVTSPHLLNMIGGSETKERRDKNDREMISMMKQFLGEKDSESK